MKIVIQRVAQAHVEVEGKTVGSIQAGALVLFGSGKEDKPEQVAWLANKLIHLRMFSDANDKMNLSLLDQKGEILIVSQFTLYADCSEGRRPSFTNAAPPEIARTLYESFVAEVRKSGLVVHTGIFGAKMSVHLINDGPVTFLISSER